MAIVLVSMSQLFSPASSSDASKTAQQKESNEVRLQDGEQKNFIREAYTNNNLSDEIIGGIFGITEFGQPGSLACIVSYGTDAIQLKYFDNDQANVNANVAAEFARSEKVVPHGILPRAGANDIRANSALAKCMLTLTKQYNFNHILRAHK